MNKKIIDKYTEEEFKKVLWESWITRSKKAIDKYIKDNPKEFYTIDDTIEVHNIATNKRRCIPIPFGTTKRYKQSDTMGSDRI